MKNSKRSLLFRFFNAIVASVCWFFLGHAPVFGFADDYVVIVNKANPADTISAGDLRKMFLGEKAAWPNGAKVMAITPAQDKPEFALSIKRATGMSTADFKRYFIQLSFLGKVVPPPRTLDTTAAIARYVGTSPGAISCVPAADAGAGVKTLKVE